ncbi:EcoKI restriction-modification system protein HsdS [Dorea longicatena]|uniref:EcoKI restriction-modification system protein HsdS n=1 Tax=Dorea longicatena TaxID=88431 RepID=A0A564USG9_9FIRM|nr:restriction endonuclease subunit S [Dorea longicatena]VUX22496.1 EcoKI restriction-modification system protein HsdS [Dorea longicatena]
MNLQNTHYLHEFSLLLTLASINNLPYEKVGKNEPVCIADEVPFEIPESWEWVRLGNIFQHNTGKALNASNRTGSLLPYITTSNLYWDRFELGNLREMYFSENEIEKCTATKGDLLVCEGGDIGRAAIWMFDEDIRIQNHIHKLRSYAEVCTEFFYYLFYLYKHAGWIGGKGIGIQGLSANALHALLFPLPPLSEQKRIVSKIKESEPLMEKYADVEKHLDKLNTEFPDQLRKSILQMAVQGKLVPQDPADESASVLLERICTEKQRLVREGKIKKDKHESVIFRRDNSHYEKRGFEEVCIDDEIPFELPNRWCWCRFSTICYKLTDGSHNPPPKRANGFRVISARNIKNGRILFTDEDRLCDQNGFNKENPRTQISKGDVILGIIGGSIGNTAIYGYDEPVIAQRSIAIFGSLINNKYMKLLLDSPLFQQQFNSKSNGTAQGGIYLGELANMLVPLPPVNEQNRILASISSLENKIVTM